MFLEITSTTPPATDLGFLLAKNPSHVQTFPLEFGQAHVFYPEADEERCTAALLVEVDPVWLFQRCGDDLARSGRVHALPYAASSLASVALCEVFGSAVAGRCQERPHLATTPLPLLAGVTAVPCAGREGELRLRRLFEPLGYAVGVRPCPPAPGLPEGSDGSYAALSLEGTVRLQDLLSHICVLVAALDGEMRRWVGDRAVERLLRRAGVWLSGHPEESWIVERTSRIAPIDSPFAWCVETAPEPPGSGDELDTDSGHRVTAVLDALRAVGARRVVDMGCGDGRLLEAMLSTGGFSWVCGVDVSPRVLERAALRLQRVPEHRRERGDLLHGSLLYRDRRLEGYDAATLVEVIQHVDPSRLDALEQNLFGSLHVETVIVTVSSPESDADDRDPATVGHRHPGGASAWSPARFAAWTGRVAEHFGYRVRVETLGREQSIRMAVFETLGETP